jgi:hypothetical protein
MMTKFRFLPVLSLFLVFTISSCKKSNDKEKDYRSELGPHSDDQFRVSNEMDAVSNDADVAVESAPFFSGKFSDVQQPTNIICDATVTLDTISNPRTVTIVYNGTNCQGTRIRTGTVVISMAAGVRWRDAGALMTISYQNLKIKRLSDNKSITINGTHLMRNVTGGRMIDLPNMSSIIHSIESNNMSITFDDNTQRSWQVARRRTFTYNNGVVMSVTGTHTQGSNTSIAEWGTNRFGAPFTTSITQPVVVRQDCSFRITSGQVKHEGLAATATVTFGLDVNGNATSCPGTGNYYYKLAWTGAGGNSLTVILPY